MGKSVISIFVALWCGSVWAQSLGVGSEFKTYSSRQIDLLLQSRYYNATGNYKSSGNSYDSLPSGYGFQDYNFDFAARTQIASKWAIFGSTTVGYSQAKLPTTTKTNSALANAVLGTDFVLSEGQISLIPELSLAIPFKKIDYNDTVAAVDDNAMSATGRLIAQIKGASYKLGGFAGYSARDQGLASLILYGVLGELNFKSWDFGADLRGYTSTGNDKSSTTDTTRANFFCADEGCAQRFDGVNPSLLESNLWARWRMNQTWELNGGAGFSVTGQNTSTGYQAVAGLVYHWGLGAGDHRSVPAVTPGKPGTRFQEETNDGVDQTLFAPSSSPNSMVAPVAQPTPVPKPKVNPAAQKKRIQKKMQDDLNKTEMQIELKSSKKKAPVVNEEN